MSQASTDAVSLAAVRRALGPLSAWLSARASAADRATLTLEMEEGLSAAERLRLGWRAHPRGLDSLRGDLWTQLHQRGAAGLDGLPFPLEQQRSGLLGVPELHGDLFVALLFHLQSPDAELDLRALAARGHDRYYRELPQMPGDLDSAAAILLSPLPAVDALRDGARARLEWALAQGPVPVWEAEGWFGPTCPAVTGRALMAAGHLGLQPPDSAVAGLLDTRGWVQAAHYPDPVVASSLVLRGLEAVGLGNARLQRLLATAPCGSWSPLAVASSVAALGARLPARRREDLLVRLLDTQRHDGTWDASPWFLVPAPQGGMRVFGDAAYTTAAVLKALGALQPVPWRDLPGAAAR